MITEFTVEESKKTNINKIKLNPDLVRFNRPDFGFNDYMSFDEQCGSGKNWQKFMDCVSLFPKNERVQNYISFMQGKKTEKLNLQLSKSN